MTASASGYDLLIRPTVSSGSISAPWQAQSPSRLLSAVLDRLVFSVPARTRVRETTALTRAQQTALVDALWESVVLVD